MFNLLSYFILHPTPLALSYTLVSIQSITDNIIAVDFCSQISISFTYTRDLVIVQSAIKSK